MDIPLVRKSNKLNNDVLDKLYRVLNYLRFGTIQPLPQTHLCGFSCGDFIDVFKDVAENFEEQTERYLHVTYLAAGFYGVFNHKKILTEIAPYGLLSMYSFNKLLSEIFFSSVFITLEKLKEKVDLVFKFIAYLLRYPMIPTPVLDLNFCIFCMFETDHSAEASEKRFTNTVCSHFCEKHELMFEPDVNIFEMGFKEEKPIASLSLDKDSLLFVLQNGGDIKKVYDQRMETTKHGLDASNTNIDSFASAMDHLKEIRLLKKMETTLFEHSKAYNTICIQQHEFKSSKFVNSAMIKTYTNLFRSVSIQATILSKLEENTKELINVDKTKCMMIRLNSVCDQNMISKIADLFYHSALPCIYKYEQKYRMLPHRVLFFKHMESLGISNEKIFNFQSYFGKTVSPKKYSGVPFNIIAPVVNTDEFKPLELLYWVCANLITFCAINNNQVSVIQGDYQPVPKNGIYIFGYQVGYYQTLGERVYSNTRPWTETLELLTEYSETLSRQDFC